jgi:hypothetical protein
MGDGGFRPAYNLQLATDTEAQIITGVDVSTSGGDQGKMAAWFKQPDFWVTVRTLSAPARGTDLSAWV